MECNCCSCCIKQWIRLVWLIHLTTQRYNGYISSLLSHCFFRISPGSANYLTGVRLLNPVNTSMFTLSYHIINCKNSSSTYQVKVLWSTPKVSKKIIISFSSHENNFLWHNLLMRAQCKSVLGLGLLVFNNGLNKLTWDLEKTVNTLLQQKNCDSKVICEYIFTLNPNLKHTTMTIINWQTLLRKECLTCFWYES